MGWRPVSKDCDASRADRRPFWAPRPMWRVFVSVPLALRVPPARDAAWPRDMENWEGERLRSFETAAEAPKEPVVPVTCLKSAVHLRTRRHDNINTTRGTVNTDREAGGREKHRTRAPQQMDKDTGDGELPTNFIMSRRNTISDS